MTNKVKPFFIRITDDMTPQVIQDALDKCVDAGAEAFECPLSSFKFKYVDDNYGYKRLKWNCFGVNVYGDTYFWDVNNGTDDGKFGGMQNEITLDQLDAHLGIESPKFKAGDECIVLNPVDTGKLIYPDCERFIGEVGVIKSIFKNKHDHTISAVEFENGACVCFVDESIGKPETPEQREERERLVAAYDLFQTANQKSDLSYDGFKDSFLAEPYLAIVDKTNYRKS